jgi:hypothetical protein
MSNDALELIFWFGIFFLFIIVFVFFSMIALAI